MIHRLKIEQNYLENIISGRKKAEVRKNDRDYQRGDTLLFADKNGLEYSFEITHIHNGLGLLNDYVVLSITNMTRTKRGGDHD